MALFLEWKKESASILKYLIVTLSNYNPILLTYMHCFVFSTYVRIFTIFF